MLVEQKYQEAISLAQKEGKFVEKISSPHYGAVVVTNNEREYRWVKKLKVENWT